MDHTTTAADDRGVPSVAADIIVEGHHSQSSGRSATAAAEKLRALEQTKIKPFLISVTVIAALGGMLFGTYGNVWVYVGGTRVRSLDQPGNQLVC